MVNQLLWIEVLLKLSAGVLLLIAPTSVAAVLGLPRPGAGFWPRLLGTTLIGIAAASALQLSPFPGRGLTLAGSVVINLAGAAYLLALIIAGPIAPTRRGRTVLVFIFAGLALLALVEIAFAAWEG
jgi:hypothetical protein